jgi:DNA-binding CsgD family transcriptional regulator
LAPLAARSLADLVAAERDTGGDPSGPMERLADLRERVPRVVPEGGPASPAYDAVLGALDLLYAAETARATVPGRAGPAWCAAAEALARAEMPWEHSYAAWRAGEALLVGGAPAERRVAAEMLRRGHTLAVRLEARRVQMGIESLAKAARITLAAVAPAEAGDSDVALVLTRREREVLAHVVAGRTYAEIATALFLSEKTVSSHISNILRKTSTANRVELAAWATRQGASS